MNIIMIMANLNVSTFNVRGLGQFTKHMEVFHFLHEKNYDVVFIQETHCAKHLEKRWKT